MLWLLDSQGTGGIATDEREGKLAIRQDILVLQVLISFPVEFLFHFKMSNNVCEKNNVC